jgi:hypothetical protein
MMKTKNTISVLLAVFALIVSSLACNLGGEPGVSNIHMSTDETGEITVSSYSPTDDFYVYFDVNLVDVGTPFEGRWYAMDIEDQDPSTPFQTIDYNLEEGVGSVYFQLFNDIEWPVGTYRVEVYMDGAKVGEQQFSVQ